MELNYLLNELARRNRQEQDQQQADEYQKMIEEANERSAALEFVRELTAMPGRDY